jgi:metal-responsive CopG/Arc/MetJ family transcriptional regulator
MKTAISMPDAVFYAAEEFAKRARISRSELCTKAMVAYLKAHRARGLKEALNEVYGSERSEMDPVLAKMQAVSIFREEW